MEFGTDDRRRCRVSFFLLSSRAGSVAQSRSGSTAPSAALDGSIKCTADKRRFALRDGELPTDDNIRGIYGGMSLQGGGAREFKNKRASVTEVLGLSQPLNSFSS